MSSPTARRSTVFVAVVAILGACSSTRPYVPPADGLIALGTWGGDSAGLIVGDTATHVHIACTFGDVSGRIRVSATGEFDVSGSYMLRAFPVAIGPTVPARFTGRVDGSVVTMTVTVNDTVTKTTVVRGPIVVRFGDQPRLGPCPICRRPIVTKAT